jgi:hypothetical protein
MGRTRRAGGGCGCGFPYRPGIFPRKLGWPANHPHDPGQHSRARLSRSSGHLLHRDPPIVRAQCVRRRPPSAGPMLPRFREGSRRHLSVLAEPAADLAWENLAPSSRIQAASAGIGVLVDNVFLDPFAASVAAATNSALHADPPSRPTIKRQLRIFGPHRRTCHVVDS